MALAALALLGMGLWSLAEQWRYPHALPTAWTLLQWQRQAQALQWPLLATLSIGATATVVALMLAVACLENETRLRFADRGLGRGVGRGVGQDAGRRAKTSSAEFSLRFSSRFSWRLHALLYLPLLVPQIAFLFGTQVLLVRLGLDATWTAVVWVHLVFVLPYLLLSLADPWRAFDERYTRTARSLGASRWRVFWRVKLPILLKPTLLAAAVAFAVSVGLYLPTLFAGAGRVATLTTEAVTLAGGADRRVIGVWAVMQALLPLLSYAAALALPRLIHPHRRSWS
jgi:putative thiamine transport system permease protein